MILIREAFITKPGMASKFAKMMRDAQNQFSGGKAKVRVMTDLTGSFNKVVMETELENLGALDKRMQEYRSNIKARESLAGYTDLYLTGEREIYQLMD